MAKTLRILTLESGEEDEVDEEHEDDEDHTKDAPIYCVETSSSAPDQRLTQCSSCSPAIAAATVKRVECDISPFFYAFLNHHPVYIVVDTGATSSVVSRAFLLRVGITPRSTQHSAHGADKSKLNVAGEIHIVLTFGKMKLPLTALVMDKLDCDILGGIPFCKTNDVHVHLKSKQLTIGDITIPYGAGRKTTEPISNIRRVSSCVLQPNSSQVVLPGEFLEISNSNLLNFDGEVAIEPRSDSRHSESWSLPSITHVIQGTVRIPNLSDAPIKLTKSQHIAHVRRVTSPDQPPQPPSTTFPVEPTHVTTHSPQYEV